ncbi:MAG: TonB-dependent receptor [Rhodospirillales bacterium]
MYGDLGWRQDGNEVHLSVLGAINNLVGNGTTPVQLLDADRAAVFTFPDETRNHYVRAILNGNFQLNDTDSVQANAYYSYLDQLTYNGDAGDENVCDDDPQFVCEDDDVLTNVHGQPIRNVIFNSPYITRGFPEFAAGGPYSVLNVTATRTNSYGGSAQFTTTREVFGHGNHFVVGVGYDGGQSAFSAETFLGGFTLDRDYIPFPNIEIDQADNSITPVSVHTSNDYVGVFAVDTLDVTDRLAATVSGRFNNASISLHDQLGTALNGSHEYNRFNPAGGLTYKITPEISAYAGYAEANRAPTPSELSCADPNSPCSLTNFFVGDPDLKQVVSHSVEAGLNGHFRLPDGSRLTAHAGYFRTENDDDIQFVTSLTIGRAFFRNVGQTLRQGAEVSAKWQNERWLVYGSYTFTDATFQTALVLNNEDNPASNANGDYFVHPGDQLPGIPQHAGKFGAAYKATEAWNVGLTGIAASGQFLFGDEGNQSPKTSAYVVFNFNTTYQVTPNVQLFGVIENMFGARYETYGTFAPTDSVPIVQAPGAANPRALTPGAPVGGYGGVRVTF